MTVGQLKDKYRDVFGESSRSNHKQFLFRRIAWRMQANAFGGLSERARRRALEIANDADLRIRAPRNFLKEDLDETRIIEARVAPTEDPRLPMTDIGAGQVDCVVVYKVDKRLHADIDKVVAWYRDAQIPDAARQGLYMNLFFREAGEAEHFKVTHDPRDSCAHHGPEHYHIIAGSGDGFLVSSKVLGRDGLSRSRRCPRVEPGGRLAGLGFSRPRLSGLPEAERSGVCQPRILVPFRAVAKNGHGFVVE